MAYVNVPKDLTKVKTKVLFNLTKRQLICFGCGALIGVPLFFFAQRQYRHQSCRQVMMVVMIPAMLFAMYEKERSAAGGSHPQHLPGVLSKAEAATL